MTAVRRSPTELTLLSLAVVTTVFLLIVLLLYDPSAPGARRRSATRANLISVTPTSAVVTAGQRH